MEEKSSQEEPIRLTFKGYAFIGDDKPGYHLDCIRCGHGLVKGAQDRQILGLKIECPVCRMLNSTQKRERGEPIPTRVVVIKSSEYKERSSINAEAAYVDPSKPLDKPVILHDSIVVSEQTLREYQGEVGVGSIIQQPKELTADYLTVIAKKAINLMGKSQYKKNFASSHKLSSSKIPKFTVHRLVELIQFALHSAEQLRKGAGNMVIINGDLLSELILVVNMFERWKGHPAWGELRKSLANSNDVQHSLMQMIVASYLADNGNGVSLVFKRIEGKKIPDIEVKSTFVENLQLEVKTPVKLHGPINVLTQNEVTRIIEKALEAASTKGGQLDPQNSGIVAICGSHLRQDVIDLLENITNDILQRQVNRKSHLAAVLICVLSYHNIKLVGNNHQIVSQSFIPTMTAKVVKHPGYKRNLMIAA